jgi:hypothetical protein
MIFQLFGFAALADHNNNSSNSAAANTLDAGFDYGLWPEGKQRLERAHALGAPGGEDDGGNFIHTSNLECGGKRSATPLFRTS